MDLCGREDLAQSLRDDMSDDCGDEYDALDFQNEYTDDGLIWGLDAGLVLTPEEEIVA